MPVTTRLPGRPGDFRSPLNFGDLPEEHSSFDTSRVVLLPVPYDLTTSYGLGAKDGPLAILSASRHMELYDEEIDREPYTVGISTLPELNCPAGDPHDLVELTERVVEELLGQGKFVVTLGGEHTVSVGPIRAHRRRHPGMSVLQLDAHAEMRDEFEGSAYSHACVARRVSEVAKVVACGVRSFGQEEVDAMRRADHRKFSAVEMRRESPAAILPELHRELTDKVYVTIDVSYFDPSIMPATGTPEPGGFLWHETTALLREVARHHQIVGFDITELAPMPGLRAPDVLAARLLYKLVGYVFFEGVGGAFSPLEEGAARTHDDEPEEQVLALPAKPSAPGR